jgi:hypothetical protein
MTRSGNKTKNKEKKIDRHLQAPQESNRDKHINFLAIEQGDEDPADERDTLNNKTEKANTKPDRNKL